MMYTDLNKARFCLLLLFCFGVAYFHTTQWGFTPNDFNKGQN